MRSHRFGCLLLLSVCIWASCAHAAQTYSAVKAQPVHSTVSGASSAIRANGTDKQARSSFGETGYGHQVWGSAGNRFELANVLPAVIIFGILLLLLPLCVGLLAPMVTGHGSMSPYPYAHGRKKRQAFDDQLFGFDSWMYPGLSHQLIGPILDTLHKALHKYAK